MYVCVYIYTHIYIAPCGDSILPIPNRLMDCGELHMPQEIKAQIKCTDQDFMPRVASYASCFWFALLRSSCARAQWGGVVEWVPRKVWPPSRKMEGRDVEPFAHNCMTILPPHVPHLGNRSQIGYNLQTSDVNVDHTRSSPILWVCVRGLLNVRSRLHESAVAS